MFEIGNSLREARYRQQLELADVEQATKIRARYLRALEEENFDTLPAQTYVKGFLRNYADYLGLDGQLYVDEYNSRYGVDDEPREPLVARRGSSVRRQHPRVERRWIVYALAGIAALFAFVIAAWKYGGSNNDNNAIPNLGSTPSQSNALAPPTQPKRKHRRTVARPTSFKLYLHATHGDCWMDVRNWSATGRSRYTGTLQLGQAQFFKARRLWIHLGAPGNLSVSLNGKPMAIPGGGVPIAVLVTPHGIARAPAAA